MIKPEHKETNELYMLKLAEFSETLSTDQIFLLMDLLHLRDKYFKYNTLNKN
jgi:hypothetical protein